MARDNANAAEQIKASQEQLARVIAKTFEAKASEQPAAQDIGASATADCHHPDAQAGADALTIPGGGHLTALAFAAAVDHPERFVCSALTVAPFTII
jgi:hypothetical protein